MTIAIRKQAYDLTLADFDAVPVWEIASGWREVSGQDEATVRPHDGAVDTGNGRLVVRTVFNLADGTVLHGYLSPQPISLRHPGWLQPVIILGGGRSIFGMAFSSPPNST